MATKLKRAGATDVDYEQLNAFSSVVLYDTSKKKRSKFYEVERIIERRKKRQSFEYLVKWKDWPLESTSWEPSENLNSQLLRSYTYPVKPNNELLEEASRQFSLGVFSSLKSASFSPVCVNMRLDVWRYVVHNKGEPSAHLGHLLLNKEDMTKLKFLPANWWYVLDGNGEGKAVDFPIKVKPGVSWSPSCYMLQGDRLCKAPRLPQERLSITVIKRPCNMENYF